MSIRIITSSRFSAAMRSAFLAGLTDAGHPGFVIAAPDVVEENGNYDDTNGATAVALYNDMVAADAAAGVDLIISAGGIVTAHAANTRVGNKPFLIIIGQDPKFDMDAPTYCGGVSLNMVEQNILRHNFLVDHYGVGRNRICLIWNQNSKMGRFERRQWHRNGWPHVPVANNTPAAITAAFAAAKVAGDAVVISGDPYFVAQMNTVVAAANDPATKQLWVCYPFGIYASAAPAPLSGHSMFYGPDLEVAYRLLGRKAGIILDCLARPSPTFDTGLELCPPTGPLFIGG
jgi:hypothetical protein